MAAMFIYGRNPLKIFFSGTSGPISTILGIKHEGLKSIIVCSMKPLIDFDHFTARSNVANSAFIWENMTMMDSLELLQPVCFVLILGSD